VRVVYPKDDALIMSRDSNFIFGSVGNGTAGLTINGELVPVWPNGSFLGWLPNPPASAPYYDLVAYTATDTVRTRYPVRLRPSPPPVTPPPPPKLPNPNALRNDFVCIPALIFTEILIACTIFGWGCDNSSSVLF